MEAAATAGNRAESASLPKFRSIFTAEIHTIHLALNTICATKGKSISAFTDSRSCPKVLQKQIPGKQKARKLKYLITTLDKLGIGYEFCWIPRHAGTPGNKIANEKAKEGLRWQ